VRSATRSARTPPAMSRTPRLHARADQAARTAAISSPETLSARAQRRSLARVQAAFAVANPGAAPSVGRERAQRRRHVRNRRAARAQVEAAAPRRTGGVAEPLADARPSLAPWTGARSGRDPSESPGAPLSQCARRRSAVSRSRRSGPASGSRARSRRCSRPAAAATRSSWICQPGTAGLHGNIRS